MKVSHNKKTTGGRRQCRSRLKKKANDTHWGEKRNKRKQKKAQDGREKFMTELKDSGSEGRWVNKAEAAAHC